MYIGKKPSWRLETDHPIGKTSLTAKPAAAARAM
jgi:hypothetical protein